MKRMPRRPPQESGEFLWLVSLSDLMILLFILFVVLFSASYKKMKQADFAQVAAALRNDATPPKNPIEEVRENLNKWVKEQKLEDKVSVEKADDAVLLQIKDKLLFASGESRILPGGVYTIRSLQKTLESVPKTYQIGIEGHTDDIPIHTKDVEDNWELSSKRALAVMKALNVSPDLLKRTVLMAYGDTRPLVPNRDEKGNSIAENQSRNRRVTLRIF